MSHWFQMIWIAALRSLAEMVQFEPLRDGSIEMLVHGFVNEDPSIDSSISM